MKKIFISQPMKDKTEDKSSEGCDSEVYYLDKSIILFRFSRCSIYVRCKGLPNR